MSGRQRPNDDSRWSTHEALDEPARTSQGWSLAHFWAKLTLLTYHPRFRKYRPLLVKLAVGGVLVAGLLVFIWRLQWSQDGGKVQAAPPPRPQSQAAERPAGAPSESGARTR